MKQGHFEQTRMQHDWLAEAYNHKAVILVQLREIEKIDFETELTRTGRNRTKGLNTIKLNSFKVKLLK